MAIITIRYGSGHRLSDFVNPTPQASTNSEVVFAGSELNTGLFDSVGYSLKNTGAETILVSVYIAQLSDYSDEIQDGADISIVAGARAGYMDVPNPCRFARLKVQSAVNDLHGIIGCAGVAK